jgi:hypothetical protein
LSGVLPQSRLLGDVGGRCWLPGTGAAVPAAEASGRAGECVLESPHTAGVKRMPWKKKESPSPAVTLWRLLLTNVSLTVQGKIVKGPFLFYRSGNE